MLSTCTLIRHCSFANAHTAGKTATMDHGKKVWAPHIRDGFILGEICDFGTGTIDVQPLNGDAVVTAPYDSIYPAEDDDTKDCEDNCALKVFEVCNVCLLIFKGACACVSARVWVCVVVVVVGACVCVCVRVGGCLFWSLNAGVSRHMPSLVLCVLLSPVLFFHLPRGNCMYTFA